MYVCMYCTHVYDCVCMHVCVCVCVICEGFIMCIVYIRMWECIMVCGSS